MSELYYLYNYTVSTCFLPSIHSLVINVYLPMLSSPKTFSYTQCLPANYTSSKSLTRNTHTLPKVTCKQSHKKQCITYLSTQSHASPEAFIHPYSTLGHPPGLSDLGSEVPVCGSLEGRMEGTQFIYQAPQRPDVTPLVVVTSLHHLLFIKVQL